jgi:hypothetical protein
VQHPARSLRWQQGGVAGSYTESKNDIRPKKSKQKTNHSKVLLAVNFCSNGSI